MKYFKQRGKYDCVPICLINAYRFSGVNINYNNLPELKNDLLFIKGNGTLNSVLHVFMKINKKVFPFKTTKRNNLNLKDIKQYLAKDKAIMFTIHGHMSLIIKDTGKSIKFVNLSRHKTTSLVSYKKMKLLLNSENFSYVIEKRK